MRAPAGAAKPDRKLRQNCSLGHYAESMRHGINVTNFNDEIDSATVVDRDCGVLESSYHDTGLSNAAHKVTSDAADGVDTEKRCPNASDGTPGDKTAPQLPKRRRIEEPQYHHVKETNVKRTLWGVDLEDFPPAMSR